VSPTGPRRSQPRLTRKLKISPGSYLALSHVTADHVTAAAAATAQGVYASASAPVIARSREQVTRLLDGLTLIEPGVCDVAAWHPEIAPARPHGHAPPPGGYIYGAVAAKR
jgi:S-adenosyl methyltransferase